MIVHIAGWTNIFHRSLPPCLRGHILDLYQWPWSSIHQKESISLPPFALGLAVRFGEVMNGWQRCNLVPFIQHVVLTFFWSATRRLSPGESFFSDGIREPAVSHSRGPLRIMPEKAWSTGFMCAVCQCWEPGSWSQELPSSVWGFLRKLWAHLKFHVPAWLWPQLLQCLGVRWLCLCSCAFPMEGPGGSWGPGDWSWIIDIRQPFSDLQISLMLAVGFVKRQTYDKFS